MLIVYILFYTLIHIFKHKQLCLDINLFIKKQHVFLLRNDYLYSIYAFPGP